MNDSFRGRLERSPSAVAAGYLILAAAWLLATDLAFASFVGGSSPMDGPRLLHASAFLAFSTGCVYLVTLRFRRRTEAVRRDLETSDQQIQVLSRVFRHNVRNDLNVVRGYTNLLEKHVDDEEGRRYLETIRETTDDVVTISEKLRVVEEVSPRTTQGCVDLVDVVHDAVEEFDDDDVEITVLMPTEAWIRADRSVSHPIHEVFENAIAHNDKPVCRLDARIDVDGATTRLEVRDNGPGLPDSERAVLQAEEETPLSHASSIGLWLVKWMCELHGGTVGFETSEEGEGTVVRLRFDAALDPSGTSTSSIG